MTYADYCKPLTDAIADLAKTADKWNVPPELHHRTWWTEWVALCDGCPIDGHPNGENWMVDVFGLLTSGERLQSLKAGWRYAERRARYNADPNDNQWLVDLVAEAVAVADPGAVKTAAEHVRAERCQLTFAARRRLPARGASGGYIGYADGC